MARTLALLAFMALVGFSAACDTSVLAKATTDMQQCLPSDFASNPGQMADPNVLKKACTCMSSVVDSLKGCTGADAMINGFKAQCGSVTGISTDGGATKGSSSSCTDADYAAGIVSLSQCSGQEMLADLMTCLTPEMMGKIATLGAGGSPDPSEIASLISGSAGCICPKIKDLFTCMTKIKCLDETVAASMEEGLAQMNTYLGVCPGDIAKPKPWKVGFCVPVPDNFAEVGDSAKKAICDTLSEKLSKLEDKCDINVEKKGDCAQVSFNVDSFTAPPTKFLETQKFSFDYVTADGETAQVSEAAASSIDAPESEAGTGASSSAVSVTASALAFVAAALVAVF